MRMTFLDWVGVVITIMALFLGVGAYDAIAWDINGDKNHINDHSKNTPPPSPPPTSGPIINTFTPTNTFNPTNVNTNTNTFSPTIVGGPTYGNNSGNTFSGINGGVSPFNSAPAAGPQAASAASPQATTPSPGGGVLGVGVSGIGQQNNSGSGQTNNGVGVQNNGSGSLYNGDGAGAVSINQKYEEARQMAVIASVISRELQFKQGAHSDMTDSRVIKVSELIDLIGNVEYEEAKRGRGPKSAVKVIDGLVRPQFKKTTSINLHKDIKTFNKTDYRFIGFATGVAAINDADMANVVFGVSEFGMDNGATEAVLVKESATEWGDTTGYDVNLLGVVTSIIGGVGKNSIGPGGSASGGVSGMEGGSSDRSDAKFALFVSNVHLAKTSQEFQKKD